MITKLVEHPSKQDVDECIMISENTKATFEEFKQQYEDFKIKINEYTVSS